MCFFVVLKFFCSRERGERMSWIWREAADKNIIKEKVSSKEQSPFLLFICLFTFYNILRAPI